MRLTLLELVQQTLAALDSDEVTSYDDTPESYQVALLIRQAYYDLATELGLPEHESLFRLTETSASTPTLMSIPSTVTRFDSVKYDNKETGDTVSNLVNCTYVTFDEFMERQAGLKDHTGVEEYSITSNSQTFPVLCLNDRFPTYYTTFDDNQIVFDSYNSDEDTYLKSAKTMCYGSVYPAFTLSNSFAPNLDPTQFSYFVNKVKTRAFIELKQQVNQEAISETGKQKIVVQKRQRKVTREPEVFRVARYGRK
jgi:hypothetical protein